MNSRYWTLAKRPPPPWPDADTFALKEAPIPTPGPGQALTRTIYVSLDPYQWGYKRRGEEPAGAPCHARTVSQVVESRIDGLAAGDFVFNTNGWAEYGLMGEGVARPGYMVPRKLDPAQRQDLPGRGRARHAGPHRLRRHGPAVRAEARRDGGGLGGVRRRRPDRRPARAIEGLPRGGHRRARGEVPLRGGGARLRRLRLAPVTQFRRRT